MRTTRGGPTRVVRIYVFVVRIYVFERTRKYKSQIGKCEPHNGLRWLLNWCGVCMGATTRGAYLRVCDSHLDVVWFMCLREQVHTNRKQEHANHANGGCLAGALANWYKTINFFLNIFDARPT